MLKKKIKCSRCQYIFEVSNPNNKEELVVRCPNPSCGVGLRVTFATGETVLTKSEPNEGNGYLLFEGNTYSLHEGLNTIGREAESSKAMVQLSLDSGKNYVSREHFAIEQVSLKKGKTKYVIMDIRDEKKIKEVPTLVNGEKLDKVDKIVLKHGDTIEVREVKMTFNIK